MIAVKDLRSSLTCLRNGKVIAYPTEAVYGLGCDPFNESAVERISQIKGRSLAKGLILVASNWQQVVELVEPIPPLALTQVLASWPGPATWVFPASTTSPTWICGPNHTVALRVSSHPVVYELCEEFGGPIISTSANFQGEPPLRSYRAVKLVFESQVDFILSGEVGEQAKPTTIRDAVTGDTLRT